MLPRLWLDNVPSQEWSVGDHVYFPEDRAADASSGFLQREKQVGAGSETALGAGPLPCQRSEWQHHGPPEHALLHVASRMLNFRMPPNNLGSTVTQVPPRRKQEPLTRSFYSPLGAQQELELSWRAMPRGNPKGCSNTTWGGRG